MDLPARSFDLARPDVAPPLLSRKLSLRREGAPFIPVKGLAQRCKLFLRLHIFGDLSAQRTRLTAANIVLL